MSRYPTNKMELGKIERSDYSSHKCILMRFIVTGNWLGMAR